MKRRYFVRLGGFSIGALFIPFPVLGSAARGAEAARRIEEETARILHADECPAHHEPGWHDAPACTHPRDLCTSHVQHTADPAVQVDAFALAENYPNPFHTTTTIPFRLAEPCFVELRVYNMVGQEVAVLVNEHLPPGAHAITWQVDGLAAGVYQYVLKTDAYLRALRMVKAL
ncbi:MAG: T9SS type A sorting domain-containing protein [Rhodothermales bacterium]|nr:T9SS type A sorting domain-containing protein [Rhodothermales bacterium]